MISTGKTDWPRDVTDVPDSLAAHLGRAYEDGSSFRFKKGAVPRSTSTPGIFANSDSGRLSILNGSHVTLSDDDKQETVLVFPDYKFIMNVGVSPEAAQGLWTKVLDPAVDRAGTLEQSSGFRSYLLPYSCVILLCECQMIFRANFGIRGLMLGRRLTQEARQSMCDCCAKA